MKKNHTGSAVLYLLFLIAFSVSSKAQDRLVSEVRQQVQNLVVLYSNEVRSPEDIINGKEYEPYYLRSKSKPLLFIDRARTATLFTSTRRYDNLTLEYDTYTDEVVYTDTSEMINLRYPQIALNRNIIKGFNLYFKEDTLMFRNIPAEAGLDEGYYETACEGESRYYIKHYSKYFEKEGLVNYKYIPKHYINTSGKFVQIKRKKRLLRLFGNEAAKIRDYVHSANINLKEASKDQIVSILRFYDSLKAPSR